MKIIEFINQSRRDFTAIYQCEGCGHEFKKGGYDDRNFHDNVIPKMKCPECGKTRIELGVEDVHMETKYPEGYQI